MDYLKVFLVGYALGSIPFGYIAGKIYGVDIRKYGSGNIGFTNAMRVLGVFPALFVLFFDALKGYLAVWYGDLTGGAGLATLGALSAMVGHNWPITLKFKGGRGVATGLGIIIYLSWPITLVALLIWVVVVSLSRYVSLGSIIVAFFVPVAMLIIKKPLPYIAFSVLGASIVILRHRPNIKRLLEGTENKIGSKTITPKGGKK